MSKDNVLAELAEARRAEYIHWVNRMRIPDILKGVQAMCLDFQRASQMPLIVNGEGNSYTDGKTIVVSLSDIFLDIKYNEAFWLLVMKAHTAHECQHVNSSNIKKANIMAAQFAKYFKDKFGIHEQIGKNMAFQTFNILEDGRIENIIVEKMPGLRINFVVKNGEIRNYNKIKKAAKPGESKVEYGHFMSQILSYAKCGGNAIGINVYHGKRLEQEFLKIQSDIDKAVTAYSCGQCLEHTMDLLTKAAPYLAELLKADSDFMNMMQQLVEKLDFSGSGEEVDFSQGSGTLRQEMMQLRMKGQPGSENKDSQNQSSGSGDQEKKEGAGKDQKDQNSGQKSEQGDGSSRSGSGQDNSQNKPGEQGSERDGDSREKTNGQNNSQGDAQSGKDQGGKQKPDHDTRGALNSEVPFGVDMSNDFSNLELETRGYTKEDLEYAVEMINQELNTWQKGAESIEKRSTVTSKSFRTSMSSRFNKQYKEIFLKDSGAMLPQDLKVIADKLHREIVKILKNKYQDRRGVRQGNIQSQLLWKIRCKEDNFFEQKNSRTKRSVAIYLLIDNSGSMSSANKSVAARRAAAIMEEAFSDLATCKIALFAAGGTITHWIAKDFKDKNRFNSSYNSMLAVSPTGGNRDGYSIRIATEELKKRPEKKKFLIVLSDGLPSDYSSTEDGQADVKAAVREARKAGVEVISMMFGSQSFMENSRNTFLEMYEKNVVSATTENITTVMGNLFKKLIV